MLEKDIITMSVKELRKLQVVNKIIEKEMNQKEAADILGITERQMRRIVKTFRQEGPTGITHKARGKPSNRKIPVKVKDEALDIYRDRYYDFGPTLASEKLSELDGIEVSRETIRGWLIEAGLRKRTRKKSCHRQWRERKPHPGEMVQMDGSEHDWLEGRGPKMTLMGFIDDATGRFFGRLYGYEGTLPALDGLKRYIKGYGIPKSIYLDKHSTYTVNRPLTIKEELEGKDRPQSQFERAATELGIKVINAHSPQAKGRIERSFGTHQDRLIKEMRLKGIDGIDGANTFMKEYCAKHNAKFAVLAKEKADFHIKGVHKRDLDRILCIKDKRAVKNDNTVSYEGKLYLIQEKVNTKSVMISIDTDGAMHITDGDRRLRFKHIEPMPKINEVKDIADPKGRTIVIPPSDHPWRRFDIKSRKVREAFSK